MRDHFLMTAPRIISASLKTQRGAKYVRKGLTARNVPDTSRAASRSESKEAGKELSSYRCGCRWGKEGTYGDDVLAVPVRVPVMKHDSYREEDVYPEFDQLEIWTCHLERAGARRMG